jgi:phage gp36-like protein
VNYCSIDDVRLALVQDGASSDTNTAADMDDGTITDAIAEASTIVDTYIMGPYAPTDTVPGVVTYWTRDVAAFLATCTWRKSKDLAAFDPVYLRYQQALGRLAGIPLGLTALPPGQSPTTSFNGAVANVVEDTLVWPWNYDLIGRSQSGYGIGSFYAYPVWRMGLVA